MGMIFAADGWPGWSVFIWITVALTGVRTLGMAANRFLHRKEDVNNPRTANRHLPRGLLKPWEVFGLMVMGTAVFFFAAAQLNGLAFALSPIASIVLGGGPINSIPFSSQIFENCELSARNPYPG